MNQSRAYLSATIVALMVAACFLIPFPHSVVVSFVVKPDQAQNVFVNHPGTLAQVNVREGDQVVAGQVLAVLSDSDLEIELLRLEGKLNELEAKLAVYQLSQTKFLNAAEHIGKTRAEIVKTKGLIKIRQKELDSLTLVSEKSGVVFAPPNLNKPGQNSDQLEQWTGTPLDLENRSAFLRPQTLFCTIGQPKEMKAVLVVDQSDVKLLEPGQPVDLVLNQFRDRRLSGSLKAFAQDELVVLPRELSKTNGGPVAGIPGQAGKEKPLLKSYEASVPLNHVTDLKLLPGMFGTAKIQVGNATLAWRCYRYLQTIIKFR